jgi:cholest-4-en-3-one 26-monooxygenase
MTDSRLATSTSVRLADIDLNNLDRFAAGVPHDWFRLLRQKAPVWRHPEPDGPGFWVVTKHEDLVEVGRHPEVFANAPSHIGLGMADEWVQESMRYLAAARARGGAGASQGDGGHLLNLDAPEHTQYRLLVNRGFTPRAVRPLEEHARDLATDLLDRVIEKGECDFVTDISMPLPLLMICELLGAPRADHDKVCDWSNRLMGSVDPEYHTSPESTVDAFEEFFAYLEWLRDERLAALGDDVVSRLVASEVGGEPLPDMRFKMFVLLLAVAGNETTRNGISHGLHALIANPEQHRRLQEDPSLMPTAVEEILRFSTPVMYMRRTVLRPVQIRGVDMAPGDLVSVWYTSANRDEAVFDSPDEFDVGRDPNPHITFGGGGPHFCLGAHLARLEIRVAIEETLKRLHDMEISGPVTRLRNNHINGIKHLPLHFRPARPVSAG